MSFQAILSSIMILCAIGMAALALRQSPPARAQLLLSLGFALMGSSHFLEPYSEWLATAADLGGFLLLIGIAVRTGALRGPSRPKAE